MLTERIYCPCGNFVRATQHTDGETLHEARMQRPVEYCDNCQQAMEIASEAGFDQNIDHSQPHAPTDMERAYAAIDPANFEYETMSRNDEERDMSEERYNEQQLEFDEVDEDGRYLGTMPTYSEAQYYENNPGYRACRCEDYPCCGH